MITIILVSNTNRNDYHDTNGNNNKKKTLFNSNSNKMNPTSTRSLEMVISLLFRV